MPEKTVAYIRLLKKVQNAKAQYDEACKELGVELNMMMKTDDEEFNVEIADELRKVFPSASRRIYEKLIRLEEKRKIKNA